MCLWPQFQVEANDTADPARTKRATITIRFKRDREPRFDNLPREQKVSENSQNNSVVYKVQGRDDDIKVSTTRCCVTTLYIYVSTGLHIGNMTILFYPL